MILNCNPLNNKLHWLHIKDAKLFSEIVEYRKLFYPDSKFRIIKSHNIDTLLCYVQKTYYANIINS